VAKNIAMPSSTETASSVRTPIPWPPPWRRPALIEDDGRDRAVQGRVGKTLLDFDLLVKAGGKSASCLGQGVVKPIGGAGHAPILPPQQ
jgi:hypothetical protein